MFELAGLTAVVTGGASGIGAACVEALRAAAATPVAWDLDGGDVYCDVADAGSVAAAWEATCVRFGPPSVLVAAAGVSTHGPIVDLDPVEWDRAFGVNLRGVMLSVQAVARSLIERGEPGAMVLVSSINSLVAEPGVATYSATKAGVNHFARVAARELGPYGIRVNAVGPGPTDTPMLGALMAKPDYRAEVVARTPLREVGTPARIAEAVVGLLGMEWVTGQALMVDGGASLSTARSAWQAPGSAGS